MTGARATWRSFGLSFGAMALVMLAESSGAMGATRLVTLPEPTAVMPPTSAPAPLHSVVDQATAHAVRQTLALAVNATVRGNLEGVVDLLIRADRIRSGKRPGAESTGAAGLPAETEEALDQATDSDQAKPAGGDALAQAARDFQTQFKAHYGQPFALTADDLGQLQILKGSTPTRVEVWPEGLRRGAPAVVGGSNAASGWASAAQAAPERQMKETGSPEAGAVLTLVNEGRDLPAWRIELAGQGSRENLKRRLVQQLRVLTAAKQIWPDTPAAMVQISAGRILRALSPMPGNGTENR